jgi:hypothetical protein
VGVADFDADRREARLVNVQVDQVGGRIVGGWGQRGECPELIDCVAHETELLIFGWDYPTGVILRFGGVCE